jgi:hypothetical protein
MDRCFRYQDNGRLVSAANRNASIACYCAAICRSGALSSIRGEQHLLGPGWLERAEGPYASPANSRRSATAHHRAQRNSLRRLGSTRRRWRGSCASSFAPHANEMPRDLSARRPQGVRRSRDTRARLRPPATRIPAGLNLLKLWRCADIRRQTIERDQ